MWSLRFVALNDARRVAAWLENRKVPSLSPGKAT